MIEIEENFRTTRLTKIKMRIDFLFFLILSPYLINFVNGGCLLSELKEPEIGFEKWVCNADTTQE